MLMRNDCPCQAKLLVKADSADQKWQSLSQRNGINGYTEEHGNREHQQKCETSGDKNSNGQEEARS